MEWHQRGVVKYFTGEVRFDDVYRSECEIQSSPEFDRLRYVLSVFEGTAALAMSKSENEHILALRLGAKNTNPNVRYAYISSHQSVRATVQETVTKSNAAFPFRIFDNYQEALDWASS